MIAGVVVGGLLGRVAVRVSGFMSGPPMVGVSTSNGNRVGDITLDGTLALIFFVGLSAGLVGGAVYAPVEPWLQRFRPWHGLMYGAGLLATFGSIVIDPSNIDFKRFGSSRVNLAMFAALFLVFGVGVAWLFDRLRPLLAGTSRAALAARILTWLALLPGMGLTIVVVSSVAGLADPLCPVVVALGLAVATFTRGQRAARAADRVLGSIRDRRAHLPVSQEVCEPGGVSQRGHYSNRRDRGKEPSKLIPLLLDCYQDLARAADLLTEPPDEEPADSNPAR